METNAKIMMFLERVRNVVFIVAGILLVHVILQTLFPDPPVISSEASRLISILTVGCVYEVIMVKDSLAVVQDLETKKITLTQSMSPEVDIDNARFEAGKRYNCISVNLGDGDRKKLVIENDSTKKQ